MKRQYSGRNTGMFYALMAQLPGYRGEYKEIIKEGVINDFLTARYGAHHYRPLRLSTLSDVEYRNIIIELKARVAEGKTAATLQGEAVRKRLIHQILSTLGRIGVTTADGDYTHVNYHIRRIPASKERTLPQIPTGELPNLLAAVRAYCGVMKKRLEKEHSIAKRN